MSDFISNFCFARGVFFRSVPEYNHIIPALLKRVWEVDNTKEAILWEVAQQGSVAGDVFIKVAYEPEFEDASGAVHPGRVRILPLHPAHCFPEWHPHDKERLLRFKLKYRFWGTAPEGTRQVFTYTEIMTDEIIEEYVNDELIDQRPNPLGTIPVVHIANIRISGSPWGVSDIADVIPLNREYNEKALEISDIINYNAAPVTIMTGAKMNDLIRGPKKIWALPNKDANVFNLSGGTESIGAALEYLERIKMAMHEMTGVPAHALGEEQAISNTSGVALSITYLPMMQRLHMKHMTYGEGIEKINRLILLTLYRFEENSQLFDPNTEGLMEAGMAPMVNPMDPLAYRTFIKWPEPMATDVLIALNEIQMKFGLGLESKRGALEYLGVEFPDEKMEQIVQELMDDARDQAALDMYKAKVQSVIVSTTGILPSPNPAESGEVLPASAAGEGSPGTTPPSLQMPALTPDMQQLQAELVTLSAGTKLSQRRNPDNN